MDLPPDVLADIVAYAGLGCEATFVFAGGRPSAVVPRREALYVTRTAHAYRHKANTGLGVQCFFGCAGCPVRWWAHGSRRHAAKYNDVVTLQCYVKCMGGISSLWLSDIRSMAGFAVVYKSLDVIRWLSGFSSGITALTDLAGGAPLSVLKTYKECGIKFTVTNAHYNYLQQNDMTEALLWLLDNHYLSRDMISRKFTLEALYTRACNPP